MVKQGSFFKRLKDKWGSGSGVRIEQRSPGTESRSPGKSPAAPPASSSPTSPAAARGEAAKPARPAAAVPPVERVEPTPAPASNGARELSSQFAPVDARSSRKMSDREEALLALGSHFQELSTMLRGSHARMDDQLTKLVTATSALGSLPALSQQQLETLKAVSAHMEKQNALGEQLASTMTVLPALLQNVEGALARAAATDERTAATVREFQSTMDRIHSSMGQMVSHSEQQAKASQQLAERRDDTMQNLASGIEAAQQSAAQELKRATDEGMQSLRRTHEDQSNRLHRVVQEHAGWNRAVLVGIGIIVLGIGALIVLQIVK